jgi:hypothetical protein
MSLKEIKKEIQIAGKGHNVTLVIVVLLEHMSVTTETVGGHVPGNGGTCVHIFATVSAEVIPID